MLTLYLISGGRAIRVVHDIPMTNRAAGIAAEDVAGRPQDGTGPGEDAADAVTGVATVPFDNVDHELPAAPPT